MKRFEGKVVFITGVARGQGREHAVRFAAEGASIIGIDICSDLPSVWYPLATEADLAETTRRIEEVGGAIVHSRLREAAARPMDRVFREIEGDGLGASVLKVADVRDRRAMREVVKEGVERFGRLDVICANAGTYSPSPTEWMSDDAWDETIDINLSGVFRTVRAGLKPMMERGEGGSIVITSSTAGLKGFYGSPSYCAAKHGVVGFMKSLALEMAPHQIRVNCVHPTSVDTPMIRNAIFPTLVAPEKGQDATWEDAEDFLRPQQPMGIATIAPRDISNAIMWLSSDEARYITGVSLAVDGGAMLK